MVFGLSVSLSAESLMLDYCDGTVAVLGQDNSWTPLDVGAKVDSNSTLKVSNSGLAELSQGSLMIHLGKDGVYQLSKSLAQAKQRPDDKLVGLTGKQISMLLGNGARSGGAVGNMGVRGDVKSETGAQVWAGDDDAASSGNPLEPIQGLIDQKEWSRALKITEKAIASQSADSSALLFDKALILSNLNMAGAAVQALQKADFHPGDSRYMAAVLLFGSVALQTEDYDQALSKTGEALQLKPETGISQSLLLVQAMAWQGSGDNKKYTDLLTEIVGLDPSSESGLEAKRLLNS